MPDSFANLSTTTALPFVHPLDEFYARSGMALPRIERVAGEELPEPQRTLLVHQNDMTPTLENFHGSQIHLEVLKRDLRGDFYFREVALRLDGNEQVVEFGASKISLPLFSAKGRQLILEERVPLGRILKECDMPHTTRAKAFFWLFADDLIAGVLGVRPGTKLFGRKATISDAQQRPLSEVVEVLPSVKPT